MNQAQKTQRVLCWTLAVLVLPLFVGCRGPWSKGWKVSDMWSMDVTPWSADEDEPETPQRLVGSWTDTVLHQTGKEPQRGFGGRVIFYGEDAEKPVLVEGQLVVYAFDETDRDPTNNKPTRRYVFPADQVARRMSKTSLGPSYSFWLPWDEVGGPQTEVSLVTRFEPKDGALIMSEQTRHLLPGATTPALIAGKSGPKLPEGIPSIPAQPSMASLEEKARAAAAASGVQLANYEAITQAGEPAATDVLLPQQAALGGTGQPKAERRMTTTSISLPENFRIQGPGTPPASTSTTATQANTTDIAMANNRFAMPQGPPPNYASVAAPISVPQPGFVNVRGGTQSLAQLPTVPVGYPTFMSPPQSPMGAGFVAPLGPPTATLQSVPTSVGQINAPPSAPIMQGQPPMTTAAGWPTASYPPGSVPAGSTVPVGQQSFGYPPTSLPAQAAPVVR